LSHIGQEFYKEVADFETTARLDGTMLMGHVRYLTSPKSDAELELEK
jgi:hypothetical protein